MGVYTYLLNKSKPWTLPTGEGKVKLYNMKYAHRSSDEDEYKWRWDDTEGKRWSALCRARIERAILNDFPTEYIHYAVSLEDKEDGDVFNVYRARADGYPKESCRFWYDCNELVGEMIGVVEVIRLKPRKKLWFFPKQKAMNKAYDFLVSGFDQMDPWERLKLWPSEPDFEITGEVLTKFRKNFVSFFRKFYDIQYYQKPNGYVHTGQLVFTEDEHWRVWKYMERSREWGGY